MSDDNGQKEHALLSFLLDVLGLQTDYECYCDPMHWSTHTPYRPIAFFVRCNDLFYWACADAEPLLPEDIPALRQAISDVEATGVYSFRFENYAMGCLLWCARQRGMRPQQPAYPKDERLRALFDACGPVRDPKDEG